MLSATGRLRPIMIVPCWATFAVSCDRSRLGSARLRSLETEVRAGPERRGVTTASCADPRAGPPYCVCD